MNENIRNNQSTMSETKRERERKEKDFDLSRFTSKTLREVDTGQMFVFKL